MSEKHNSQPGDFTYSGPDPECLKIFRENSAEILKQNANILEINKRILQLSQCVFYVEADKNEID